MPEKVCTACKTLKDEEEYYPKVRFGERRGTICKECTRKQVRRREAERYTSRPGKNENVGDALMALDQNGFTQDTRAKFDKSPQFTIPFERYPFDPQKAIERAGGAL